MKKIIIAFMALFIMVMNSCDCGCETNEINAIECKNPEITVYKLYKNDNVYTKVVINTYDTPEAVVKRYSINGETRNVEIIPKEKEVKHNSYFDF